MKSLILKSAALIVVLTTTACSSVSQKEFGSAYGFEQRQFDGLNVDQYSKAEQKAVSRAHLNAAPKVVFEKMADHENINQWIPMIDHEVQVDHSHATIPGENGVGTIRICEFGGDTLTEEIRYFNSGHSYAYSVIENEDTPATDHLGVITIEDDGKGGSLVSWRQYFTAKPWSIKARVMPTVMGMVMDEALENLAQQYGGEVL